MMLGQGAHSTTPAGCYSIEKEIKHNHSNWMGSHDRNKFTQGKLSSVQNTVAIMQSWHFLPDVESCGKLHLRETTLIQSKFGNNI